MKKRTNRSLILIIVFLIGSLGCNFSIKPRYYKDDIKLATPKVEEVIKLYNENNNDKLYESFHQSIKDQQNKGEVGKILSQMQERFGKIKTKKMVKSKVRLFSAKERAVHFLYEGEFDKTEDILHIAVITNDNNEAQLFGINVYEKENLNELIKELERN